MQKPHELDEPVRRRAALGILGGFGAVLASAPFWNARTELDVEINIGAYHYETVTRRAIGRPYPGVVAIDLELTNHEDVDLTPLFTSWDHRRKTRHEWTIDEGPEVLDAGERARYRIESPGDEAAILAGYRAQLTVWQLGEQHWRSIHFTPEVADV